ncbi:TetR/AcrR family transcriptional regulator [Paenibacillus sp. KQZ6P-2]|uniref:TetR/AcrR family transcriptional regulator n=1 Tax=Paenibacillus mangrovi TaxID=2931978 RepID=A0A9X2B8N7_9BACL|nr:TetR/AcrR family transcriptional regulator [Paenibacillus mangrovi]MCJ8014703.1 TetR/AcrR family transcriptional regulator [Paenibacillus mangrovi]
MPRTPEANDKIRRAASEKILKAAMQLFMKKGYHATSIDDVAKEANISKGLLYNYYEGKEGLLAAMVDLRIEELMTVMNAAISKVSPAAQIQHLIEGAMDNVQQQPDVFRFYLHLFTQPMQDKVLAKYTGKLMAAYDSQFHVQCKMFENLGVPEPRKRSVHLSSTLQGIMLMYSTYPNGYPLEEVKVQVIADYCQ